MQDVNKKVLLDLFAAPSTVLPAAFGITGLLAGWALSSATIAMIGILGVVAGVGMLATRLIFGLDKITNRAYQTLVEKEEERIHADLDALDQDLTKDGDPRTQESLRELRQLYDEFHKDIRDGKTSGPTGHVVEKVEQVFQACIEQLKRSYEMYTSSHSMLRRARQLREDERDEVIMEVRKTVTHLGKVINEFHSMQKGKGTSNLQSLRKELETTMKVAKDTESRMDDILGKSSQLD